MDKKVTESVGECSFLYSSFDSSLSEDEYTYLTLPSTIYDNSNHEKLNFSNETDESVWQEKRKFKSRNLDYLSYLPRNDMSNSLICSNCSIYLSSDSCDYTKSNFTSDYQTLIEELQHLKTNMTKFKSDLVMNEIKIEFNHLVKNLRSELNNEIQSRFNSLAYEQSVISAKLASIQCNLNCSNYVKLNKDNLNQNNEVIIISLFWNIYKNLNNKVFK